MVYSTRRFVVCLSMCHFVLLFFSPFSNAITSLGEERANLSAFRTFPVLVLLFVALWFILRGDLLYVFPCVILFLCFFSPFSIAITSLGVARANLSAFRTFVRFVLVWICRFPLPLGVREGLRFVIVALPGLFSYLFLKPHSAVFSFCFS